MSHPTRVRGLKRDLPMGCQKVVKVAPHAGAWIETSLRSSVCRLRVGRTPRGCVD